MKPLRQLLVGGALASTVVAVGCSEPTTLAREQPSIEPREIQVAQSMNHDESPLEQKFRESAMRAAAVGDSQGIHALHAIDSIKRATTVDREHTGLRAAGSDGARRLGILEDAQANIPNAGWTARIISASTTPTIDPFGNEFYITSFVQFFGTHGSNQVRYRLSGTASGGADLPASSGNTGVWVRCLTSITSLASCTWTDSYTSVDRVAVQSTCGASMSATALHQAWFAVPQISVGVSGSGYSVSTNGSLLQTGGAGSFTDAGGTASNGRCITITMAETTAPSSRITATISGSCQGANWTSSDPTVAYLTNTAAGTASIDARASGTSVISVTCSDGANGSKVLAVQRPEDGGAGGGAPNPSEGGATDKCAWYHVYLIDNNSGTVIMELPDECLSYGYGTSRALGKTVREGMVALDLSRSAIQPAFAPPTQPNGMPACQAANQTICWAVLQPSTDYIDPENPWASPGRFLVAGGYNTAYPLTITYRYNGKLVYSGVASDPYHVPDPPTARLTGVVDGDQVVFSATVTDRFGVTLSTATTGWVVSSAAYGDALRRRELNRTLREAIRNGDKTAIPKLRALRQEILQDMLARQPKHTDKR